jgi:hypothetical protein
MSPTTKPKLAQLKTPVTATFPSELSALSARTPLSAVPDFLKEEYGTKTPISPPTAYMDFLKAMSTVTSPVIPEKRAGGSSSSEEEAEEAAAQDYSAPSTASSVQTDCSCKCGNHHNKSSPSAMPLPSPFPTHPMSAPPVGPTSFPSLHIPPSPATGGGMASTPLESPMSASTQARSPFSARSVRSPFDWEAALKAGRYSQDCCKATKASVSSSSAANRSVRHIREVVTRTVTYTPRMNPAPKGKRRRTECAKSQAMKAAQAVAAAAGEREPNPGVTRRSNSA